MGGALGYERRADGYIESCQLLSSGSKQVNHFSSLRRRSELAVSS